uniref:Uncharacterized protein n=1 Tax=Cacopsylla melanoneura TaxID=428564 RepID=A0A8D8QWP9_9HEMI
MVSVFVTMYSSVNGSVCIAIEVSSVCRLTAILSMGGVVPDSLASCSISSMSLSSPSCLVLRGGRGGAGNGLPFIFSLTSSDCKSLSSILPPYSILIKSSAKSCIR